jgi:sulfur carrier protein
VSTLTLTVNGEPIELSAGSTVADVVAHLIGSADAKGIAVAVDRSVVPRSQWSSTTVLADSRIEVVTATAGG